LAVVGVSVWARQRLQAATEGEIARLLAERETLQRRFRLAEQSHDPLGLGEAPPGDVVIGLPTHLQEELLTRAVTDLLGEVRIQLKDLHIHHEEDVRAHVLLADRRLAHMFVDLDLPVLAGTLRPGIPRFRFGGNKIELALQISIVEGAGHGSMHFRWDGRGLSNLICGSLDITREISGRVTPRTYDVKGAFVLSEDEDQIVAVPEFGDFVFRLEIEPSAATWAMVDETIERLISDRNIFCGYAVKSADVPKKVREEVNEGFEVRLPPKIFRPIRLPAAFEQSIEIKGRPVRLQAHPIALGLTARMLWFGANLRAEQPPAAQNLPPPHGSD
jgi:hypothetical protein